jgi:peptide/nickel transport system substrate-binding protein
MGTITRRSVIKGGLAGAAALAAPSIVRAQAKTTLTFIPHADLASLDPVWTTADITRNYSLAVFDTLFAYDAQFKVQPQMVEGHAVENEGKDWTLTLRDGLKFHDGTAVLARDCVASIQRCSKRNPMTAALMARVDEMVAASDKVIRIRLKKPFALLPAALAEIYCVMMPESLAKTDPFEQIKEAIGSGPFKFVASERIAGSRAVFEKNPNYVPRHSGTPSFNAGPKIVHFDRVVWSFLPDPSTAAAALQRGEVDWWEQPQLDLVPQLKADKNLVVKVLDRTGEIGCLRFNHLHPPFDNPAVRRVVATAFDQKEVMTAVAGSVPEVVQTDVGLFVPGTPMANDVGVEVTRGPKDYTKIKKELEAAGYKGERIVVLAATTIPSIFAMAQVASDVLQKIGMNVDFLALEWGAVVARRANKETNDKGGWNVFYTWLGGFGNILPGANVAIRSSGGNAWFGWPTSAKMEALRDGWFDAPDTAAQQKLCRDMQTLLWQEPTHVPLGMYDLPNAYHKYLQDVRDGWPQMYGVRRA